MAKSKLFRLIQSEVSISGNLASEGKVFEVELTKGAKVLVKLRYWNSPVVQTYFMQQARKLNTGMSSMSPEKAAKIVAQTLANKAVVWVKTLDEKEELPTNELLELLQNPECSDFRDHLAELSKSRDHFEPGENETTGN